MTPLSPTGNWIGTVLFVLLFLAGIGIFAVRAGELVLLLARGDRKSTRLNSSH